MLLNLLDGPVAGGCPLGRSRRSRLFELASLAAHVLALMLAGRLSWVAHTTEPRPPMSPDPPHVVFVAPPSSFVLRVRPTAPVRQPRPTTVVRVGAGAGQKPSPIPSPEEDSPKRIAGDAIPKPLITGMFSGGLPVRLPESAPGKVRVGVLGGDSHLAASADGPPMGVVVTGKLMPGGNPGGRSRSSDRDGAPSTVAPRLQTERNRRARLSSPVTPVYTDEARRHRTAGIVKLRVLLGGSGEVRVLDVISGLEHGLTQSAIDAVNSSRCVPALENGKPVDVVATVGVEFNLS